MRVNNKRLMAIEKMYGLVPVVTRKVIKVKGEEFSGWYINGYPSFADLLKIMSLSDIEKIYDSGE
ncbi:hypothetical protein [Halarcobacter ebronensis]|uniref:Uncharacterized protein n=1 Tax=Halarcobacter ebronensis TaxID=1462615 RepID=A0A4Q1AZF6_9BACT|nr:hypothetical protein [Halarcobacter ebronensis]QKF82409.1 hypothetical protein AEBR_1929 [Halarcobacter ebronensis]RXK07568.1 hypothetical protein CRV07_03655 [Halarcobacter ebronensis]